MKLKAYQKVIGGLLLPLFFALFILDRSVCLLLPHLAHPSFGSWMKTNYAFHGLIRVVTVTIITLIIVWLK